MTRSAYDAMMGVSGRVEIGAPIEIVGDRTVRTQDVAPRSSYREGDYTKEDVIDLGFREAGTLIGPGLSLQCNAVCSNPFKPLEFMIDSSIAADVSVTAIDIASARYVQGGAVPGSVYSEASTGRNISWDTVQSTVPIQVTLRNDSAVPVPVRMSIRGRRIS